MDIKTCYQILGVQRWVSDAKLKSAYHKEAKKWHPDMRKSDKHAAEKFNECREAYETICQARDKKRKRFETILKPFKRIRFTKQNNGDGPIESPPMRGNDIYTSLKITFEESVLGCEKDLFIKRLVRCHCSADERGNCTDCNGTGKYLKSTMLKLQIPRGICDCQTLKIIGKGSVGEVNAENGDLLVNVHIQHSKKFERRGLDIYSRLSITYPEAVLGTQKVVSTIYGDVNCKIPHGIESGAKLMLTAKGVIDSATGEIGNHYVIVRIDVPKSYSSEQEICLKKLADSFKKE